MTSAFCPEGTRSNSPRFQPGFNLGTNCEEIGLPAFPRLKSGAIRLRLFETIAPIALPIVLPPRRRSGAEQSTGGRRIALEHVQRPRGKGELHTQPLGEFHNVDEQAVSLAQLSRPIRALEETIEQDI